MPDAELLGHEPCPKCPSSDAYAVYDDGGGHCFSCGHHKHGDGSIPTTTERTPRVTNLIDPGEPSALPVRRIDERTCQKFRYTKSTMSGEPVQVANYCNASGEIIAQKIRTKGKDFKFLGDTKNAGLFGMHLWRDNGKMVVVTEGEIDALSMSQVQGNKWPVVSVPTGAKGAAKAVARNIEWLEKFDKVVFMFDMDKPGQDAAIACSALLSPGRAAIASLPRNDANEMLVEGETKQLIDAMYGAKVYRPDGILSLADIVEEVLKPVEHGVPWPWDTLTKLTHGRRRGEVYTIGAGSGTGKTDVMTEVIAHTTQELKLPCGVLFLEQDKVETVKRIAGKIDGKLYHISDGEWTPEDLVASVNKMQTSGADIRFYDNFGACDWDIIKSRIRYMVQACGIKDVFLDHLTALAALADDQRIALEVIMAEAAMLAKELQFTLYMVSHLATPEGTPHEEGGRVTMRHFKGSRAIAQWSHCMFGLERDQQAENEVKRRTTTFRILKARIAGLATGEKFFLRYEPETGRLVESDDPNVTEAFPDDGEGDKY